jgi:hypothetical protein
VIGKDGLAAWALASQQETGALFARTAQTDALRDQAAAAVAMYQAMHENRAEDEDAQ